MSSGYPIVSAPRLIDKNGLKILLIAEIRGELSKLNDLAKQYGSDIIIHTGNFGFFDENSIDRIHESYLRHIVEFSPLLSSDLITSISKLSKVSGDNVEHLSNNETNLKKILENQLISELPYFLKGERKLDYPVYTVSGMCEDSIVLNKFKYGIYSIPNLFIIDEDHFYKIKTKDGTNILLTGLGGSLSYHKLFHHGTSYEIPGDPTKIDLIPVSGDPGNIWVTMLQLGKLIDNFTKYYSSERDSFDESVKFFITHQSPTREPLLQHLSIFFKMDFTVSNGLHFKYPSSYNELSINPNFENFKLKFNESRLKLSVIWFKLQEKFIKLLENIEDLNERNNAIKYISLALDVYDKIPVSTSNHEEILSIKLTLPEKQQNANKDSLETDESPKKELTSIIRQLNDLYYLSFQNTWHFNLCDLSLGSLVLNLNNGEFNMECHAKGFNFNYRKDLSSDMKKISISSQNQKQGEQDEGASNGKKSFTNDGAESLSTSRTHYNSKNGSRGGRGRGRGGFVRGSRGRRGGGFTGNNRE
ncbi:hypothetical protein PACTADRAFT_16123 [Pachysolen tannophilus NRRL Y-2460]|uniref:DUF2433 domain-containing protein n=1 Tax=Pachysolen tannophilus NRRL Y-2460 TaxID=669874 RepID=A0A1E4TW01_PACTA|nr:hypothetical protein PACTADRAFT_16123 [Pachysolen tannophilus NRRL Y-2460]